MFRKSSFIICTALFFSMTLISPANAATELITNGGFETGDFTGWDITMDPINGGVDINDGTFDPSLMR